MKYSNENSINTYYKTDRKDDRETLFNLIIQHPNKTRKEYLAMANLDSNNGGRFTELKDADYFKEGDSTKDGAKLIPLRDSYNPKDFTAEKLYERKLKKHNESKWDEHYKIVGKAMLQMVGKDYHDEDTAGRFIRVLEGYVKTFKTNKNEKEFEENLKTLLRVFGA